MNADQNLLLELNHEVEKFKTWISQNFSLKQINEGTIDDAGYPEWNEVENLLQRIFEEIDFKSLNDLHLCDIIYIIARNWDVGTVLSWLTEDSKFSQIGMKEEQFLIIAEYGANSPEWDARFQIAGLLYRVSSTKKVKAIELSLKYYEDKVEFVRRRFLSSLFKLGYSKMHDLLEKSWLNNEEYERMFCLDLWREINMEKYNFYLNESLNDERAALREYAESLNKGIVNLKDQKND